LRETIAACVAYYGHVPQVAEFAWWRDRELEKAQAEGNDALHLPSATPTAGAGGRGRLRCSRSAIRRT